MLDFAIRNGLLVDGSGVPPRRADVGVVGERVVEVGSVGAAAVEIDASGRCVAPGFVDPHSHSDWSVHANRDAHSTIRQGVTTEVVGNCGLSNAPVSAASIQFVERRMRGYGYEGPVAWRSFGEYLADVESGGTAQNLAFFVGHSAVRAAAGVTGAGVSEDALGRMEDSVREAMEAGTLGMSSGLEYSLGAFAGTPELARLTAVVGRYGGMYASHVRNRDSAILDAVGEFLAIAGSAGVAGQISHLNVRHDTNAPDRAWERAVQMMVDARADGVDVQADTTPFREGLGLMTGILPGWLVGDGYAGAAEALADPVLRSRLRSECDRYWRFIHKGQWHRVRLLNSARFPELNGRTFPEIARIRGQDVWDSYFDVLAAAGPAMGDLVMVGELFTEEHLAEMISHPLFSLGVDAFTSVDDGPLCEVSSSPLPYSGHIHYLVHHVRERKTLSLTEAIRKMSAMPASRFRLGDRGLVKPGYFADLVVFDFDRLSTASTFQDPARYPEGIELVMVNGAVTVEKGRHTGSRSGRVLRRGT